ncbi:hypothetical protein Tco_0709659 [Tanacetum coccineum]
MERVPVTFSQVLRSLVPRTGDQPPVTDSSSSHDTTQDSRDSLEGTNRSEGDQVQPSHDSNLLGGPTSDKAKGGMTLEELSILCTNLLNRVLALEASKDAQATKIIKLKAGIKKLKKKREENAKPGPTLDNSTFDDLDADHGMDYMDTEEPVNEGRISKETGELNVTHDTGVLEKGGSNEEPVSAAGNTGVSTAIPEVSTATPMTPPTTTSVFEDEDIFLADALIAKDVEVARLLYEKELAEFEKKKEERQRQEQASMDYIANLYDEVQAKIDASEELAARLQMEEREMYTVEERSRSKKDERMIEKVNKKEAGVDEEEVLKEPHSIKVKVKEEGNTESTKKRPGIRLKMKATKKSKRQKTDSDLEEEEQQKAFLMIVPDEEGEIDYEVLDKRYPIVDWEYKFYHTDIYGKPHNYYSVFRADGSSRYIKFFTEMVSRFDRLDFIELHSLVMKRFETSTPEGIDLILWGSLRTMFEANAEDDLWKNQEEWILKSWNFYDNCGVHILVLEDGTEFYMLAERRYPLTKETLERMLALRLIAESESEAVFDLLRFIQKQIDESGSHDGSEKDL